MSTEYTQEQRLLGLETVLGANDLLVRSFSGWESISKPFRFDLELISENDAIDLDKLLGTKAALRIGLADGKPRYWSGHLSRLTQGWRGPVFTSYRAELVPWLWFLGLNRNSRIFQDKKTQDILREVFTDFNFKDFEFRLEGNFPKREYCVQYRETDLAFAMRLMEEDGFFFFFEHHKDRHLLIIANKPTVHPICDGQSTVRCRNGVGGRLDEDYIYDWRQEKQYVSAGSALVDFNFKTPTLGMLSHLTGDNPFEVYDQPGNYTDKSEGDALNRVRLEEIRAAATASLGAGNCRAFTAGHRFKLKEHYRLELNTWYVLFEVRHHATQAGNFIGDEDSGAGDAAYHNDFVCLPYSAPFRPPRHTPTPFVEGCQTAIVVGPGDEEIYTDEFGRVKVQFHWDRQGSQNEKSSCWIRVAQSLAGKAWGAIAIPRVGQEVVVDFLEGNPDRPLITGCVYNAQTPVPYPLPAGKDLIGIKSNSSTGGAGYNEIVIKDTQGGELIRVHGQKDMHTTILHDQNDLVKNNKNIHVSKEMRTQVDQDVSLIINGDLAELFAKNHSEVVTEERYLKASRIILEAEQDVCIKVGGNHLHISSEGIYLEGSMIDMNCGHPSLNTVLLGLVPTKPDDPE